MKMTEKILIMILFLIFLFSCSNQDYSGIKVKFNRVSGCSEITTEYECIEVTSCIDLDSINTYYLLMNDVSSNDTCFTIGASNITLDLNANTVEYAQAQTGHAIHESWSNSDNITVKNGRIEGTRKLGETNQYSHAIYFETDGSNDLNFSTLEISVGGLQTEGIVLQVGNNLTIHTVDIELDSEKADPCSHYGGHIAGIKLSNRGGVTDIYNNSITGSGMVGITMSDCGTWDSSTPALIHDNYVSMWSPVRDGYAIGIGSRNNHCSDGIKIYSNTIEQENGRGIIVAGWDVGSDYGPGNVEVYENDIYVQEGADCEYRAHGTATGIRVRFGAHDVYVHDNNITGVAGKNIVTGSWLSEDGEDPGSTVIGLYVGSTLPHGLNNRYENNYIDIETSDEELEATALYIEGGHPDDKSLPSSFKGNTFKTNSQAIRISWTDGGGYNASFDGDRIIRGDNPLGFKSIVMGFWCYATSGIALKDIFSESGASVYDMEFIASTDAECPVASFEDIKIDWTLNVKAVDGSGDVEGCSVVVNDDDEILEESGTTNVSGLYSVVLTEKSFEGLDSPTETDYGLRDVIVTCGTEELSHELDISGKTTLTFDFSSMQISSIVDDSFTATSEEANILVGGGCSMMNDHNQSSFFLILVLLILLEICVYLNNFAKMERVKYEK